MVWKRGRRPDGPRDECDDASRRINPGFGDDLDGFAGAGGPQHVELAGCQRAVVFGKSFSGDVGVDVALAGGHIAEDVGQSRGGGGLGNEPDHAD